MLRKTFLLLSLRLICAYLTMLELLQFFLRNAVLIFTFHLEQFSRELKCFRKVIDYIMNKMKQLFGLNPFLLCDAMKVNTY